jgi:glycosyltransferase involved in cell wall biosynthesis
MAVAPHLLVPSLSRAWESAVHGPTIRAIRKVITEERAAVLHTNNQVNRDFYAIIAAHTSGVPCIAHLRSFFSFGFNRAKARYVNQAVARFVAYSPAVAEHWIRLGIERGKTEIVYNGIGALDIRPRNLHSELNLPQNRRIIGAVGKVIPERGYDWLIRAFARLVRDARDVSLVIVGGGEASRIEQLKVLANDLGVGEHVIFTGFQKRAADLIAAMDVLVLPYTIEPFGRVLLEAWSLGIPTVLTDVGGVREITNDGRASLIVPPRDEISLARAISMIISEHPLADRLTEAGKEAVATRFNMKTYAAEMERIYHDALAAEGKPRT